MVADRGQEFAFIVGGSYVRWGYTFTPVDDATLVTESWEFLPDGEVLFAERFGADAEAETQNRAEAARTGIADPGRDQAGTQKWADPVDRGIDRSFAWQPGRALSSVALA